MPNRSLDSRGTFSTLVGVRVKNRLLKTALLAALFILFNNSHADEVRIAVAYPEVREPYNQVFVALLEGISSAGNYKTVAYTLTADTKSEAFIKWVEEQNVSGIVALGNRGMSLAREIQGDMKLPLVVGGTFINGSGSGLQVPAVSMAPMPLNLFKKLKELNPKATKVNVVYEAEDKWLIEIAQKAAEEIGIQLNAVAATDIRALAAAYQTILKTQKSKSEALWLPYSGKSLEKALMNEVLEMAWRHDLTVFSSNLADVSKGVLFSLYPDNDLSGKRLAKLLFAKADVTDGPESTLFLSEDLFAALNTRTVEHLGMRLDQEERSNYKILFPLKR